jgi:ABC-type lipoprotein export system ATPase subunit
MERPLAWDILDLPTQLNERFKTIVIVTHDSYAANFAGYVRHLAKRVLLPEEGGSFISNHTNANGREHDISKERLHILLAQS